MRHETIDRALIFTRTKHGADKVARGCGRPASQPKRSTATNRKASASACLRLSAKARCKTLVATDIAARGIDVDGISHVVNFDLPNVPETYVHRIGRTARAGAEGIAISLCDGEEVAFLRDIEKLIRMSIPVTDRRTHPHARSARRQGCAADHANEHRGRNVVATTAQQQRITGSASRADAKRTAAKRSAAYANARNRHRFGFLPTPRSDGGPRPPRKSRRVGPVNQRIIT